jgi:hypothetical protein
MLGGAVTLALAAVGLALGSNRGAAGLGTAVPDRGRTQDGGEPRAAHSRAHSFPVPASIHKIKQVVVIMQENRSFDSYFGTYPGAKGFPTRHGRFSVCVPNPAAGRCDHPYHDPALVNVGGKHNAPAAVADIAGGKMYGFLAEAQRISGHTRTDVMATTTRGRSRTTGRTPATTCSKKLLCQAPPRERVPARRVRRAATDGPAQLSGQAVP